MSGPLQCTKFSDEYREAWESAVRENPACGFMQSLTWAELQARQGVEVYPRLWFRDGRIEGGAIFQAARSLDGPGILVTPGGPLVPWHDPRRAALLFAEIRREAGRLRREASSGGSSPVSLLHCRLRCGGSSAHPSISTRSRRTKWTSRVGWPASSPG